MCDYDVGKTRPGGMTRRQFIKSVIATGAVSFTILPLGRKAQKL